MARKTAIDTIVDEDGADLLREFTGAAHAAGEAAAAARAKTPRTPRAPKTPKAPRVVSLEATVAHQESNPTPWVVERILGAARRRVAAGQGELSLEQAITDVASYYGQLAADAQALAVAQGIAEQRAFDAVGLLMNARFRDRLAALGATRFAPAADAESGSEPLS